MVVGETYMLWMISETAEERISVILGSQRRDYTSDYPVHALASVTEKVPKASPG